jgi:hypothetical protein
MSHVGRNMGVINSQVQCIVTEKTVLLHLQTRYLLHINRHRKTWLHEGKSESLGACHVGHPVRLLYKTHRFCVFTVAVDESVWNESKKRLKFVVEFISEATPYETRFIFPFRRWFRFWRHFVITRSIKISNIVSQRLLHLNSNLCSGEAVPVFNQAVICVQVKLSPCLIKQ